MLGPVRQLAPSEWRLLRHVRLAALADAPEAFGSTWAHESSRPDDWWMASAAKLAWFVATTGTEVTGLVAVMPADDDRDHHVVSMWVAPEHRGSGTAGQLMTAVVGWALDQGASRLVLDVVADNGRARRFYEKEGFAPTGTSKPLVSNPAVLTHELRLELGQRRSGAA